MDFLSGSYPKHRYASGYVRYVQFILLPVFLVGVSACGVSSRTAQHNGSHIGKATATTAPTSAASAPLQDVATFNQPASGTVDGLQITTNAQGAINCQGAYLVLKDPNRPYSATSQHREPREQATMASLPLRQASQCRSVNRFPLHLPTTTTHAALLLFHHPPSHHFCHSQPLIALFFRAPCAPPEPLRKEANS